MNVPGHTLGAIAYFGEGNAGGAGNVFTGDTLFLGGCGRVFEGTMPMMRASLMRLAALPSETRVWVGHEYTAKNLEFALHVEPSNAEAASRLERVRALRAAMTPTVPGTIGEERATNPFLRSEQEALRVFTKAAPPDDVFAAVRAAKDKF
jgi:hydroxyacylglutathione hydrolase